jgi:hypothetical protein
MGSRDAQTTTYWADALIQVVCGCFRGTLEEFGTAVEKTHGDNTHGKSYKKYIKIVRAIISMEQEKLK